LAAKRVVNNWFSNVPVVVVVNVGEQKGGVATLFVHVATATGDVVRFTGMAPAYAPPTVARTSPVNTNVLNMKLSSARLHARF
jgi:hypothetical protein